MNERKATLYALIAVGLWSTVATAFKLALQHASPIILLFGASCVSLVVLASITTWQQKWHLLPSTLRQSGRFGLLLGFINPVLYYLVLFAAYDRLPAQVAQPVNYTWAITLSLLSVPLLKQRLRWQDIAGLILGYAGVVVISLAGKRVTGSLDLIGLSLALISTVIWAGYWIMNTRNRADSTLSLLISFAVAVPVLAVLIPFWPDVRWQWSFAAVASVVYVGLFEMGITFVFWQMALKSTDNAARVGTLIFLSPFISLFLISLVLKEPLQWQSFAGLALIISGVWWSQRKPKTAPAAQR